MMAAHKYWRIHITANNGQAYTGFSEIEMRSVADGPDLCVGGVSSESSYFNNQNQYRALAAFDNTISSGNGWVSNSVVNGEWIKYAFINPVSITQIALATFYLSNTNPAPKDFTLQYSDNDIDFVTEATWTNETSWVTGTLHVFDWAPLGFNPVSLPIVAHIYGVPWTPPEPFPVNTIDHALEIADTPIATSFQVDTINLALEIAPVTLFTATGFEFAPIDFALEISATDFRHEGPFVIQPYAVDIAVDISETWLIQDTSIYALLATEHIWYEGDYPDFEYVPGTLPIEEKPLHWGLADETTFELAPTILLGNVIRNDNPDIGNWSNNGVLVDAPLLYFYGCDVTPKSIDIGHITEDYFVPIQISNNHLGQSIEIRSLFVENDPFGTMEITPHNWPKLLAPYSVETYTLKVSATEGYPSFEATLVVDAGTCYTEIPITGSRDVDCPECPECPPPCPPEETEDMPSCMIEQELCAISRGDTVPFNFVFTTPTGAAMDISNMQLEFTLKLDVKQEIPDLINTVTFPATPDSIGGIGTMKITPAETLQLLAGAKYCFKFKLKNGVNDVYTVGLGWVSVNPDPPTAISE